MTPAKGLGPVRCVVVGAGRLTEVGYLPAFSAVPDVTLVGVVDPDAARADAVAAAAGRTGPRPVTGGDLDAVVADLTRVATADDRGVDAVIVASPVPTHVAVATAAAAGGFPTLVEKPPAPDAAGARALAALTPTPSIGFNRRFDPGAQAVRVAAATAEAAAGGTRTTSIAGIEVTLAYRRASWQAVRVDDDALADLGPHAIDWVRWVARRDVAEITSAVLAHDRATVEGRLDGG